MANQTGRSRSKSLWLGGFDGSPDGLFAARVAAAAAQGFQPFIGELVPFSLGTRHAAADVDAALVDQAAKAQRRGFFGAAEAALVGGEPTHLPFRDHTRGERFQKNLTHSHEKDVTKSLHDGGGLVEARMDGAAAPRVLLNQATRKHRMTASPLQRFMQRLGRDPLLQAKVQAACTADEVALLAQELGYEVSGSDLLMLSGQNVDGVRLTRVEHPGEYPGRYY